MNENYLYVRIKKWCIKISIFFNQFLNQNDRNYLKQAADKLINIEKIKFNVKKKNNNNNEITKGWRWNRGQPHSYPQGWLSCTW